MEDKFAPAGEFTDEPAGLDAKVEIFFLVSSLPQNGQITPFNSVGFLTRSSNGLWQSAHSNSNNGMSHS